MSSSSGKNKATTGKWIKVSDQRLMLKYNWAIQGGIDGSEEEEFCFDFKANRIRLGTYCGCVDVDRKKLHSTRHLVSYDIHDGGCQECRGPECYEFTLLQHSSTETLKLKQRSYFICFCMDPEGDEQDDEATHTEAYVKTESRQD